MDFDYSAFNSKIAMRSPLQNKRDIGDIKRSLESKTAREKDLNSVDLLARSIAEIYGLGIEKECLK